LVNARRLQKELKENGIVLANVIASVISGLVGGLSSALMSLVMAAYFVPMPIDAAHHVVGYGISGFICGAFSGFMGVYMYIRRAARLAEKNKS
jgi:MFS superfamily sulfate permease-like transporter